MEKKKLPKRLPSICRCKFTKNTALLQVFAHYSFFIGPIVTPMTDNNIQSRQKRASIAELITDGERQTFGFYTIIRITFGI